MNEKRAGAATEAPTKLLETPLRDVAPRDVTLLDEYELNALRLELKYLKSLDADRLLRGFCDIAGVESTAELYGGWESSAIQGHTLGHYLTAVSQAYAATGDSRLRGIGEHIITVLSECQNESGYLAAIPEEHYFRIEQGDTKGTWVPWYSMHKILSGIISAYEHLKSDRALEIASELGNWVFSHTSRWDENMQKTVLSVEYGGMNDCLYQLYRHTGSQKHLSAAHSFDEPPLFDSLFKKEDVLDGKHANTTIPKIIGALNRYRLLGEEYYLRVAENFWDIVICHHTYITGGNSEWEHFGQPDILDKERTSCNCETCNSYNMLKLTRELFKLTGSRKYADYYENTFINAILSSQNPETGMTTYFQPMASGFFKVFSSPAEHFWCCTGSGMESFTKLGDSIYFLGEDSVYINRFTSSELVWREKGITLRQRAELPKVSLTLEGSARAEIMIRVPDWCTGEPELTVNGRSVEAAAEGGYVHLFSQWQSGDRIDCLFPMGIKAHGIQDSDNVYAFRYGPWVLSARLGKKNMTTGVTGVNVTVPVYDNSLSDEIKIIGGSLKQWLEREDECFRKIDDTPAFCCCGTDRELIYTPHYKQYEYRYGIYMRFV